MKRHTWLIIMFTSHILSGILFAQEDCTLEFQNILGIEDYRLNENLEYFERMEGFAGFKKVVGPNASYSKYSLKKEHENCKKNITLEYTLTFQHRRLLAYEFEINIGLNIEYYEDLIEQMIKNKKNQDFINGKELRYWYSNKTDSSCHRYIRLVREKKNYSIKGGISKNI